MNLARLRHCSHTTIRWQCGGIHKPRDTVEGEQTDPVLTFRGAVNGLVKQQQKNRNRLCKEKVIVTKIVTGAGVYRREGGRAASQLGRS